MIAIFAIVAVVSPSVQANAKDPGLIEGPVPMIRLANGNLLEEAIVLMCKSAKSDNADMFRAYVDGFFGSHKDAASRERFQAAYPYIRCEKSRRNLIMQLTWALHVDEVLNLVKFWKPPLNIYRTTTGQTELDFVLADANQMKEQQGMRNFNRHRLIYRDLTHPRWHAQGEEARFACQIEKTCDCSEDPTDFGRSCGKWSGPITQ